MGDQMMKAQIRAGKTLGLKEIIAQGLEGMDNLGLRGSRSRRNG